MSKRDRHPGRDRDSKRDREYARSMGRDSSDTFDAEILPGGKRRQLEPCMWCDDMIEKTNYFYLDHWAHPDRYDVDDDGRKCADGEHDAEPRTF
jgi:hypothetical protein